MFSGSVALFVGSLLRLTFWVFIVFGFVEGNEEPVKKIFF